MVGLIMEVAQSMAYPASSPGSLLATLASSTLDHAVSIDVSTCSSHDISQLDSTIQGLVDRSHEVMDSTGCTVPINLRAILRAYRGDGHYPRGPLCIIAPKENVSYGGAPQSIFVEDS